MASITNGQEFLEDEDKAFAPTPGREAHTAPLDVPATAPLGRLGGLGRGFLGDAKAEEVVLVASESPPIEQQHAELLKLAYMREALLADITAPGQTIRAVKVGASWQLALARPEAKYAAPWSGLPGARSGYGNIFGADNSKMKCPSFDLPAGAPSALYGTCPGAAQGQSITQDNAGRVEAGLVNGVQTERVIVLKAGGAPVILPGTGQEVNLRESICQSCYAVGGNYLLHASIQVASIMRYLWSKESMKRPETRREWINVMVDAIKGLSFCDTGDAIRPVRLHSAGDFFTPSYALAWVEVINQIGREDKDSKLPITIWAPTRTWAASASWIKFWQDVFGGGVVNSAGELVKVENPAHFVVRPSAFHFGDPAPVAGQFGSPAAGTTAVWDKDVARQGAAGRYEWTCRAYATKSTKSCPSAEAPDDEGRPTGKPGCRACWTKPHLRVAYSGH
jgi:hypothetical protein